jgi:hypothetical protein
MSLSLAAHDHAPAVKDIDIEHEDGPMSHAGMIDAATAAFLETAAADLRAQLGASAVIDEVRLEQAGSDVEIAVTLAVADERVEVRARGATLVDAYADLWRRTALPVLESAYRQVLGA